MNIRLGTFARTCLEAQLGPDIAVGLQAALSHYARRLESGRVPARFPRFRREPAPESEPHGTEYEIPLDVAVETALKREELRQPANLEELATHSVFVFLADMAASPHAA
jgi:hypothetical protein